MHSDLAKPLTIFMTIRLYLLGQRKFDCMN